MDRTVEEGAHDGTASVDPLNERPVRRRAERALQESEERFRDLAESLPLTVFETDLQGRFTFVNRAALEAFGYGREELTAGTALDQVLSPEDRVRAREAVARRLAGCRPVEQRSRQG